MFRVGDVLVRHGIADTVELVLATPATEPSGRWSLRLLYFGKSVATDIVLELESDARLATEADHAQARAYAERRKDPEESSENEPKPRPVNLAPQLELFPSPAGEGELGPSGRARSARGARGPSGGAVPRRGRGGAKRVAALMALEAAAFGRGFRQ